MIITVTLNPAVDKTVRIPEIRLRGLNRLADAVTDVGGKGINVSRMIKNLGGVSVACGFIAGNSGEYVKRSLEAQGIQTDFVAVHGETRTNLKLVEPGGELTEFNEMGPKISGVGYGRLKAKLLQYASARSVFVFAGSVGAGLGYDTYYEMIRMVKTKKARVILDADGEAFAQAVEARPDMVKPNEYELAQYFHRPGEPGEPDLVEMGQRLLCKGIQAVVISRGGRGALCLKGDRVITACPMEVEVCSSVGAGDAMVGALAYAMELGWDMEDAIVLGMASSAGAVMTEGTKPPPPELVRKLYEEYRKKFT